MTEKTVMPAQTQKVGIGAFIALAIAIALFSGTIFSYVKAHPDMAWLGAFDFTTLCGKFGSIAGSIFRGKGGTGARDAFLFSLTLFPPVMTALGLLDVLSHYGALRAAQTLLTPLLRPMLGIPGGTGLALVTNLQSTDASAAITKGMFDNANINTKELVIMCGWMYTGCAFIASLFSSGTALFAYFLCPVWKILCVILLLKFVGGFVVRLCLNTVYRGDFQ